MGQINVGIDNLSPQHIDRSYGRTVAGSTTPYTSVAQANASVVAVFRYKGKTVIIDDGSGPLEYWWKDGTADVNLVLKAGLAAPYKLILTTDGSYVIPQNLLVTKILVIPTANITLRIGLTSGGGELMADLPMLANQANVINLDVPAWGSNLTIYFSTISASTEFLIYRETMIPINP